MNKVMINCVECPKGCEITVETDNGNIISVTGNSCPRGKTYAESEIVCPRRVLTTTVKTADGKVVPVKTDKPVKKSELFSVMAKINAVTAGDKIRIGDVIIKNVTEDIDVVATDNKD